MQSLAGREASPSQPPASPARKSPATPKRVSPSRSTPLWRSPGKQASLLREATLSPEKSGKQASPQRGSVSTASPAKQAELSPLSLTPETTSPSPVRYYGTPLEPPAGDLAQWGRQEQVEETSARRGLLESLTACDTGAELHLEDPGPRPIQLFPGTDEEVDEDNAGSQRRGDSAEAISAAHGEFVRKVFLHEVSWPKRTKLDVEDHLSRAPDLQTFDFFDWRDRICRAMAPIPGLQPWLSPGLFPEGGTLLERIREDPSPWRLASRNLRVAVRADRMRWQREGRDREGSHIDVV